LEPLIFLWVRKAVEEAEMLLRQVKKVLQTEAEPVQNHLAWIKEHRIQEENLNLVKELKEEM